MDDRVVFERALDFLNTAGLMTLEATADRTRQLVLARGGTAEQALDYKRRKAAEQRLIILRRIIVEAAQVMADDPLRKLPIMSLLMGAGPRDELLRELDGCLKADHWQQLRSELKQLRDAVHTYRGIDHVLYSQWVAEYRAGHPGYQSPWEQAQPGADAAWRQNAVVNAFAAMASLEDPDVLPKRRRVLPGAYLADV